MMGLVLLLFGLAVYWLRGEQWGRAGVALAVLAAVKPQYAVVLLLIVVVQGWWRAALVTAITGSTLAVLSLALVGWDGLLAYLHELGALDPYGGNGAYLIDPGAMINWRALLLHVFPALPDRVGFLLTNALALITIGGALLAWKRAERRREDPFGWPLLIATAATLLASYHSHVHGAALLLVPYLLLRDGRTPGCRWLIATAFWPPVLALALLGPAVLALRPALSLYFIAWLLGAIGVGWRAGRAVTATVARDVPLIPLATPAR
jgi:hypothetical protein